MAAIASLGTARATEPAKPPFAAFPAPLPPTQLEGYRAQGLYPPGSETKLGVILWDEYRRVRQPPDTPPPSASGAVTLAHVSIGAGANPR
jgi:hypothetical protein